MRLASSLSLPGTGTACLKRSTALRAWPTGIADLDAVLKGGLAHGRLHEFYAAEPEDAAATTGLAACVAIAAAGNSGPIVWLRSGREGVFQGSGWAELGGAPDGCLIVQVGDALALLRASVDAVRGCGGGVVVIEGKGRMPELDLTASRRLSLAAEKSGGLLLLVRNGAEPSPSSAETRWGVAAAPSQALPGHAPGMPMFDIELLRHRSGPAGHRWRLEWNRDRRLFRNAALPGVVVPVPVRGAPADGTAGWPHDARHAA